VQEAVLVKIAAPGHCGKKRFGRIQKKVPNAVRAWQSRLRRGACRASRVQKKRVEKERRRFS
jgi:hypothetical protein